MTTLSLRCGTTGATDEGQPQATDGRRLEDPDERGDAFPGGSGRGFNSNGGGAPLGAPTRNRDRLLTPASHPRRS